MPMGDPDQSGARRATHRDSAGDSKVRLVGHAFAGAAICAALLVGGPLLLGESALVVHAILVPLVFIGVSVRYFRAPDARPPMLSALVFAITLAAVELALVDARLRPAAVLESVAFWIPLALVFGLSWATGSLLATRRPDPDPEP